MVADLKYVFEVDDKDIITSIKNHQILEKRLVSLKTESAKLDAATNKGKVSIQDYAKANEQLTKEIEQTEAALRKGGKAVNQLATGMNVSGKSTRNMELQFQQAGYQIQDFIVQVQGGVNPLIALSQQGSQLAGFFAGPWGAAIGLGIAALSSFAMVMLSSSEESKKTGDTLSELEDKIKSITESLKDWTNTKKAAAAGLTVEEMFGVQNADQAVKKVEAAREALKKANESAQASSYTAGGFGGGGDAALTAFFISLLKVNGATKEQKKAVEDLIAAEKVLADLRKKQSEEREKAFLKEVRNLDQELNLQKTIIKFGEESLQVGAMKYAQKLVNIRAELDERVKLGELERSQADALFAYYKKLADSATTLEDKVGQAYLDALNLGKADVSSGINKAAEAARLLAANMGISLSAAMDIINVASLADKGGQAFINSPAYDPSNTRAGAYGNQDSNSRSASMAAQSARKLREWQAANPIATNTGSSGGSSGAGAVAGRVDTQEEYLSKLVREYDMKKKSLGLTDEQIKRNEFLFTLDEKIATMKTKRTEMEIQTEKLRAVAAYDSYLAAEKQAANMEMISSELNSAFLSMIDGSASVSDAFRSMMFNILKSVYEQTVTQPLANGITGLLKGFLGGGGGGTGSFGLPMPFANGGVVGSPTTFAMSGGKTGLMGEAGPEAIMPLKRGSNGQLGVQVNGGSGGMTVNNNITVTGSDAAAVRMEVAKMIPQITNATKAAIIDAKRRGGQMGAAFQ